MNQYCSCGKFSNHLPVNRFRKGRLEKQKIADIRLNQTNRRGRMNKDSFHHSTDLMQKIFVLLFKFAATRII